MPQFQVMIERANTKFASSNPSKPPGAAFPRGTALGEVLAAPAVSIAQTSDEVTTANAMPPVLQEALKGAVYAALESGAANGMQFVWFEAPEWSVEIGYVGGAGGSVASVSVLIRSPKNPAGIKAAAS